MSLSPVNCTDAAQIKADEEKAQKVAHAKQVQDAKKKEDAAAKKRREKVEHAQIQKGTVAFRFFFLKKIDSYIPTTRILSSCVWTQSQHPPDF